jgi:neutral ceramidase
MSGRRLRRVVRDVLIKGGISDPVITIAGLSNSYTHYITTFEEYNGQRYEAASTLFGPHTLSAYIQEFKRITLDLIQGNPSMSDKAPDDLSRRQLSLLPPVELDTIGIGKKVG